MTQSSPTLPCTLPRHFTSPDSHPYELVPWETRTAEIVKADGTVAFQQEGIEVPTFWSDTASNIVASKYFRGQQGTPEREWSVKQMIDRVVDTITEWGGADNYFFTQEDSQAFRRELTHILLHQYASFNSPVWFNIGCPDREQSCSACYILAVEDSMSGILEWYRQEGLIFSRGAGSGVNISTLRAEGEPISKGGFSSGPLSFMRAADASAFSIKSGGTTRRSARMVVMDVDHPDILKFIWAKANEEKKARALALAGYDDSMDGEIYATVAHQNCNMSISLSDDFLHKAQNYEVWCTKNRTSYEGQEHKAEDILRQMAEATWQCGDPGAQFTDTINAWHTTPNSGRIEVSNPCCFVGETLIDTSEGYLRFDELHEIHEQGAQLPFVFSHNTQTNLPVLRQIKKVWVAGHTRSLVKVNTDKGITLLCTPEHKFLLRNGYYIEARQLEPGMRLRKIARWRNKERRNCAYINHRATDEHQSGTVHQARFLWEQVNGPISEGYDVHHINEDPTDDRISNLQLKPSKLHQQEHARGSNNPRFIQVDWSLLVEVWEAIEAIPKGTHNTPGKPSVTPNRWNKYILKNNLSGVIPRAGSPTLGGRIQGMTWLEFEKNIADHKTDTNDAVLSTEAVYLDHRVPVYDMEVEGTHNFAVTDGEEHSIIVHNSEYFFLNNTACNLASINLLKFLKDDNSFNIDGFCHTVNVLITAQEILVGRADYPTPTITRNSHDYRTLGLGYANLGALLMAKGLPYDSDAGRNYAATITALMTGQAYKRSAELAIIKGPFAGFEANKVPMMDVILKHVDALSNLEKTPLTAAACEAWNAAFVMGDEYGFRNAQVTLAAPTGTISLMMDCATTGIEPDVALVNYKKLAGGGTIKKVNPIVGRALRTLGFPEYEIDDIVKHVTNGGDIGNFVDDDQWPVFDCAFPAHPGGRAISWQGHVKMVAALQPFLSGGLSKSVNLPHESTVEDIQEAFLLAWKLGCKSIAIYRDGCKQTQVLTTQQPTSHSAHNEVPPVTKLIINNIPGEISVSWSTGMIYYTHASQTPQLHEWTMALVEGEAVWVKTHVGVQGTHLCLVFSLPIPESPHQGRLAPDIPDIDEFDGLSDKTMSETITLKLSKDGAKPLEWSPEFLDGTRQSLTNDVHHPSPTPTLQEMGSPTWMGTQGEGGDYSADPAWRDICQLCGNATREFMLLFGARPARVCRPCVESICRGIESDTREEKPEPQRKRLPDERSAMTHKFSIAGHEGYITVGLYESGQPGELFIKMAKEGSTLAGFADALGCMISISLQFGVPLSTICAKLQHTRFEPSGFTTNKALPMASSVVDYIARWLQQKFVDGPTLGIPSVVAQDTPGSTISANERSSTSSYAKGSNVYFTQSQMGHTLDAPICVECGSLMLHQAGSCYQCRNCGGTSGGCS